MVGGHRRNQSFLAQVIVKRLAVHVGACPVVAVGAGGLIGNGSGRMRIVAPRRIHLRVAGVTQEPKINSSLLSRRWPDLSLDLLLLRERFCLHGAAQALCTGRLVADFWLSDLLGRKWLDSEGIWLCNAAQAQSIASITSSTTLAVLRAHRAGGNATYTGPIHKQMLSLGARVLGAVVSISRGRAIGRGSTALLLRMRVGAGGIATARGSVHGRIRRDEFEGGGMLTVLFAIAFPPAPHLRVESALPISGTDLNGDRARHALIVLARLAFSGLLAPFGFGSAGCKEDFQGCLFGGRITNSFCRTLSAARGRDQFHSGLVFGFCFAPLFLFSSACIH